MKFKRLRVRNLGPIKDIELHYEDNKVYHYIAENDSGKSMILEAKDILCNNIPNIHVESYIRDGSSNFLIEGEDFDGNIIQLQRGRDSWYKLTTPDGKTQIFDKIQGKVPASIQKIVNVYNVKTGQSTHKFNFRYLGDPILFTKTTGGETYVLFQKALGTDEVVNSLKKANSEQFQLEKAIKAEEDKIDYERDKLKSKPELLGIKEEIERHLTVVVEELQGVKTIQTLLSDLDKQDKLRSVGVPQELIDFDWSEVYHALETNKQIHRLLMSEDKVATIETELQKTKSVIEEFEVTKETLENLQAKQNILTRLTQVKRLELREEKIQELKEQQATLHCLTSHGTSINEVNDKLKDLREKVALENQTILARETLEAEIRDFMKDNNFCPVMMNKQDKDCPLKTK